METRDRVRLRRLRDARWSTADARWVLNLAQAEGLSLGRLAREHDLQPQRLYWWKTRLGVPPREPTAERDGFVAVTVVDERHGPHRGAGVVVETATGVLRIHLERGFDPETLSRVLDVLAARC